MSHEHTQPRCFTCYPLTDREQQALNAFDALLAVAKAVDAYDGNDADPFLALDALNAAHPGWREWV